MAVVSSLTPPITEEEKKKQGTAGLQTRTQEPVQAVINPVQQPKPLPYIQQGQRLPVVNQPGTGTTQTSTINTNPQYSRPNTALNTLTSVTTQNATQGNTPVMQAAEKNIMGLLANNQQAADKNKQVSLEQFRQTQAQNIENQRRAMADVGNSGINMRKLYDLAAKKSMDEAVLGQQIDTENQNRLLNNLTAANNLEQTKAGINTANIQNLVSAAGLEQQTAEADKNRQFEQWKTGRMEEMTKLGWDQDRIKQQMQIESAEKMQQLGITSSEKIAFAGLNIEQQKLAQQAMQFNNSLDWEKSAFAQNLSQEDKKLLWQAAENEKARLGEIEIAKLNLTGAKELKNLDIASQKDIQATLLAAQKEMQKTGLSAEAQQKELDRMLSKELQLNEFKNSKEMQALDANLKTQMQQFDAATQKSMQKDLFANQQYMQSQGFTNDQIMAKLNKDLQLEIQAKQFAQSKEMQALDQAGKEKLQSLDAATQKEIQANLLKATKEGQDANIALQKELQKNELAQQAMQFTSKQDFDKWALQQNLSQQDKEMIWQSTEKKLDREHQKVMQDLQQQFELKGMNYQAFLSSIDKLPPEQQAKAINDMAVNSGVTYDEKIKASSVLNDALNVFHRNGNDYAKMESYFKTAGLNEKDAADLTGAVKQAISNSNGALDQTVLNKALSSIYGGDKEFTVKRPGIKPINISEQDKLNNTALYQGALKKYESGEKLTDADYNALKSNGIYQQWIGKDTASSGDFIQYTTDARGTKYGKRAYRFTDQAWGFLESVGKGGIAKGNDGELYKLVDYWEPGEKDDKYASAYITWQNVKTGETFTKDKYTNDSLIGKPLT